MGNTHTVVVVALVLAVGAVGVPHDAYAQPAGPACDDSLWQHVYHGTFDAPQDRLEVIQGCISVTGTIVNARPEKDGDFPIRVDLDAPYQSLLNDKNMSAQHGYLVVEPVCEIPVLQQDTSDEGVCDNFSQNVFTPAMIGRHVQITGAYVTDMETCRPAANSSHPAGAQSGRPSPASLARRRSKARGCCALASQGSWRTSLKGRAGYLKLADRPEWLSVRFACSEFAQSWRHMLVAFPDLATAAA